MWGTIARLALKDFLPIVVQAIISKFGSSPAPAAGTAQPAGVK